MKSMKTAIYCLWAFFLSSNCLSAYALVAPGNIQYSLSPQASKITLSWTHGYFGNFDIEGNHNWHPVNGSWEISGGVCKVTKTTTDFSTMYYGEEFLDNFIFETDVRKTGGSLDNIGINFFGSPHELTAFGSWASVLSFVIKNGFWILWCNENGGYSISNGWETISGIFNNQPADWNRLKVSVHHGEIKLFINDTLQGSYSYSGVNGHLGLRMKEEGTTGKGEFDNIRISPFVEEFRVYRNNTLIGTTTGLTFEDDISSLTPNEYTYHVVAAADVTESSPSEGISIQWQPASSGGNACSTFDAADSALHVPCFSFGSTTYSLDLTIGSNNPSTLELTGYNVITGSGETGSCASFDPFSGVLFIPCIDLGEKFWGELALGAGSPLAFGVRAFGYERELFDADGDGFSFRQGDCADGDPTVFPGASEVCGDGIDQDCNGADLLCDPFDIDDDGDGFTENQGDCNDSDPSVRPGGQEICGDGIDQDCDGVDLACPSYTGHWQSIRNAAGDRHSTWAFLDVTVYDDNSFSGTYDTYAYSYTWNMPTHMGTFPVSVYNPIGNPKPISGWFDVSSRTGAADFSGLGTTNFSVVFHSSNEIAFVFPEGFPYTVANIQR